MKFRKLILYSFLLSVLLFSVAAISASDLNGTYDGSGDILKDSNSEGSYSDLSGKIKAENSSFSLEKNYKFNDETDEDYDGILLNKSNFVVNGNNHVIDGNNQARAFKVTGDNVTINNLIINNTVCESGSAILAISNLTLNNVTFINCHPINNPQFSSCGAILAQRVALNINNCKFIDTYGEEGASITAGYSSVNVVNSSFISSSGKLIKGHIYLQGSDMLISNSSFLNTSSRYATAIFAEENGNVIINNTKFKNLAANKTAGAIAVKGIILLAIINCEFDNVSSANNGGAVFADGSKNNHMMETHTLINGTKFTNCSSGFGGAILQLGGNLNIVNSTFSSNSADYEGGAIYTSYADIVILNSKFISNSLSDEISYGGACYLDKGDVMITESEFINNTGSEVSTLVSYDSELILKGNYFNNPSNVTSIYSVFGNVELDNTNNLTGDRLSLNNTDFLFNFEGSQNHLVLINNSLVFDKMPEKFDLRSYNWTSPVKDQGFMGACWAFGSMAALESALMRYANVTYLLSVNNVQNSMLKFSKYGNEDMAEGGLPFSAVAYLIDWLGVFPEKYEGYDELGKISSLFITPEDIHILNVAIIPIRKNATDNDLIKDALIKYGAVAVSHHANFNQTAYFNQSSSAQYFYGKKDSNHRVCIVGWDDTYSKNNFLKAPEGDGAWIVKNSWGTGWGDGGYFYVSYYDTSIAMDKESVAFIINNEFYDRIYQHDVGGEYDLDDAKYYANVFVAEKDEMIAAVGTMFNQSGSDYEFTISVNGVDVHTQKGISEFGGYATIKLNKYIQIKKGDVFKVTFKNQMFYRKDLRIHVHEGQSFGSMDGKNWKDLKNYGYVAILKAYTVSDFNITQNKENYYYGESFIAKIGAGENVLFEINGVNRTVVADENGSAKLELNYAPGAYALTTTYNNISIVSYIAINTTVISSEGVNIVRAYNSDYGYKFQLVDSNGTPLNSTPVNVLINGVSKSYTSDNSGYVTVKFTKLAQAQKIVVTNPVSNESKTININVVSRFSGASDVVMYYFDGSKFKVKVIGDDGNAVGKNQVVTISLNKKTYRVKTDEKGFAVLKIPNTVKPGKYQLAVTYKGQTIKKTVKVKQNLKNKKYTVRKSAKKLIIKATLKNGKKAVKNKKLILKIKGKKIAAKTNKKGVAKFTIKKNVIKKLKAGKKYTVKISYLKNTIKTTVKVKR